MNTRSFSAVPVALCLALALAMSLAAPAWAQSSVTAAQAPAAEVTTAQWREDLAFMAEEMERRHANLYHSVSRERLQAEVASLHSRIPTLQRNQIIVGMMRIAAMVGDGHTRVDPRKDTRFGFRSLPLRLYMFEDGLYVRAAAPQHAELVGARIEAIGGIPTGEAIRRAQEIVARDNEMAVGLFVPLFLNMPDILHALGLSGSRDAAVLQLSRGNRRWTATVPAGEVADRWPPDTDASFFTPEGWTDAQTTVEPPMWLAAPLDYHRMIELPEHRSLYVQINMVTGISGQSLDEFARRIGEQVRSTNPRAVILDLRLNQGGNGNLRTELVRQLIRAEDEDTRLFVLTWRGTFSASQFILDDLDRLTGAVFIGEPASSKPSSYGDSYRTLMPNSGITVRSSIYWWQQGQNREPWTWVDIATPLRFDDYAAGRDPALEAALAYQPAPSLQDRLLTAARSGGAEGVRRELEAYRSDVAHRYANLGVQLPHAAERLFNSGEREAGLVVAQLAAEQLPTNVDAFNVLAHLAEAIGQPDLARPAATRVLELDPNNRVARSLLERLSASEQ